MKVSIIGLGKLGAPMAAVMAHKGHSVVGVDINPAYVAALQEGRPPVNEPGLAEMIRANRERCAPLRTTTTRYFPRTPLSSWCRRHPTPTGRFQCVSCCKRRKKSAVSCGKKRAGTWWCSQHCDARLHWRTAAAGAGDSTRVNAAAQDFGLCYNPEFIALGSVIRDMLNPDMILIGESEARSGEILEAVL